MKETIEIQGRTYDSAKLVQDKFGISHMTLKRWVEKGLLPQPTTLGFKAYYDRELVHEHVTSGGDDKE